MIYFLPTPIGNLADISYRTIEILQNCDIIFCEDTRIGKKLLLLLAQKFDINFGEILFYSVHSHNEADFIAKFDQEILREKNVVFMSDAGMPCISDPGAEIVKFAIYNHIDYEVIPGANAVLLAVASSGLVQKEFIFLGFLPNNGKERDIAIQNALNLAYPAVIYESPKRIFDLIKDIAKYDENREIFLIKEATKKFETKFSQTAKNLLEILSQANLNGEWVCVLSPSQNTSFERISVDDIISLEIPPKQKAKLLAKITGENAKKIYEKLAK